MKVLMVIRPDADTKIGGDRIQMIETAKGLRNLGFEVLERVGETSPSDYQGIDIVHLFNLQTRTFSLEEASKAKAAGIPIALSTIWWEPSFELIFETSTKWSIASKIIGRTRALTEIEKRAAPIVAPDRVLQKEVADMANVLLPNSWAEAKELRKLETHDKIVVVTNGIDVGHYDPEIFRERPKWLPVGDFVMCVARIERLKGQLGLASAAKKIGIPCVLIGDVVDEAYADQCRRLGAMLVGRKGRDELASAYQSATVYVQPSIRETPGLASLEAAAMGCPVVITKHGSTREYFGDLALYLDPFDEQSILDQLGVSLKLRAPSDLSGFVRTRYPWRRAAEATAYAYHQLIN